MSSWVDAYWRTSDIASLFGRGGALRETAVRLRAPSATWHLARVAVASLLLGLVVFLVDGVWPLRFLIVERNFREVEPGRIYAGAYQHPGPLRRIIARHHIKTVVSLTETKKDYGAIERKVLGDAGVALYQVRIPSRAPDEQRLAAILNVSRIIADPENHPVYVHCWGGSHRTGIAVAIYRMRHCGWTEQAALQEMLQYGGASEGARWPQRLLRAYAN